jgi:hypothetical protein
LEQNFRLEQFFEGLEILWTFGEELRHQAEIEYFWEEELVEVFESL